MVVNVPAKTYSVYVTPPGGSELTVGLNYGFRNAATSLDTWTIDVNKSPGGSVTVSNLSVSGSGGAVAAPSFSPGAGTYSTAQTVLINDSTSGASMRYTTDGVTTPTETVGTLYTGSISISTTTTLKAIAYKTGMTDSTVTSGQYTISPTQVAAPTFNPGAGTYTSPQTVAITTTTSGASIRYTTDGVTTPTETVGTLYSGSVPISTTTTLKAIAYETGMTDSTVTSGLYTINPTQVAAPTFSPAAGTYTSVQRVAITTTTSGASIRYTTDGVTTPTETVGTLYSGPVPINVTTTLKAIAYETGLTDSTVTSGLYTINLTTRSLTGSSGNGFHALALTAAQTGTFTATFDATPTVSPENAVVGLSKGAATAYGNLSCIARFNPTGQIDAYNGTAYQAAASISYAKNTAYHFRMVVNVTAHTYSVYVTPAGGTELTVGLNYAFRSTAVVSSLDTWNLDVNATPSGCSLTANNLNP
jgi:DNA-binding transcriptional regulator GbsR (MarR family)